MTEGPLGLGRPFAEADDTPLLAIFQLDNDLSGTEARQIAQRVYNKVTQEDIVVSSVEVESYNFHYVVLELGGTNVGGTQLDDLSKVGMTTDGYRDYTISTVGPEEIPKYG